jgi:hypothetical protein
MWEVSRIEQILLPERKPNVRIDKALVLKALAKFLAMQEKILKSEEQ